jgi:Raf kinase inhibitor-like YbhB/YbcL family protein
MSRITLGSFRVGWHALNEGKGVANHRQRPRPSKTQGVPPRFLFIHFIGPMFIPTLWLLAGCAEQKPGVGEPDIPKGVPVMQVTSTAFKEGEAIPEVHGYENKNLSPPLKWSDGATGAKSFALICDDPDAPRGTWVHWVLFNIPADVRELNAAEGGKVDIPGAVQGKNDFKKLGYGGPAPPSGTHRYYFKLYALDKTLDLKEGATKEEVVKAMNGHIVAEGQLMGKFSKK